MKKIYITIGICLLIMVMATPALALNPQPEPPSAERVSASIIYPPNPYIIFVPQVAVTNSPSLEEPLMDRR
ncbi:hypothetical protein ANME2D_00292 [Candidatus Methanoperedens nitroreducens]|uniref:Uncharacterized protein n=1 Tax=Candidatus Methanoperedens nitratireducens TaxID=1392998 RepID=A0A062VDA2_9EURY|nr:hypothetical protein [Candidatus Methanoperedens nitroreducens]KCZ73230.1 hypothetical protein ANME2D_00292 [Candidatus Methanoperedens nitroreducens]MDJ1422822.1 hypothetical protein [Candidatus Methanoperedens sp.]